jgi:type II secretory pathway pseudopilin PulG
VSLRRARSAGPASALFRHLHGGEGGFSIAEELVSLIVLASAVGLVLAGIYLGSQGIRLRRGQVLAAVLAQSQLELVADTTYSANPTAVPYPTVEPVTGLAVAVEVDYWTAPDGPFTSTVRNDGMQRITVSVADGTGEILSLEELKVNR